MEAISKSLFVAESRPTTQSRKWLWLLLLVPLVAVLLCVALAAGVFFFVVNQRKSSPPFQMALEQIRLDAAVVEKLGQPVKDISWIPSGNVSTTNSSGTASLRFDVAGPKGKAGVYTEARRINGRWGLTLLEVSLAGQQRICVDIGAHEGPSEAPLWLPEPIEADHSAVLKPLPPPGQAEAKLPLGLDLDLPHQPERLEP